MTRLATQVAEHQWTSNGEPASADAAAGRRWSRRLSAWADDRCNPILVKQTRQALKSRQFQLTFSLVLLAAWLWSLLGVALAGPSARHGVSGHVIFMGYLAVLTVPLLFAVPFNAFRSLTVERDDRTLDLLLITRLKAGGIIGGMLASSAAQIALYLAALAPCLAATYLLRGIDLPTIALTVGWTTAGSLGLCLVGLLLATWPRGHAQQMALTTLLVLGLAGVTLLALLAFLRGPIFSMGDAEMTEALRQATAPAAAVCLGYAAVLYFAAAAGLTSRGENRTAKVRLALIACQGVVLATAAWLYLARDGFREDAWFWALATWMGLHWGAAGMFLCSQAEDLTSRVRRGIARHGLGRLAWAGLLPGPETGYLLVVSNLVALLAMLHGGFRWHAGTGSSMSEFAAYSAALAFYVAVYLGLAVWLTRELRRRPNWPQLPAWIWYLVLFNLGWFAPLVIHLTSPGLRGGGYTLLQLPNVFWTLLELAKGSGGAPDAQMAAGVLKLLALAMVVVHLLAAVRVVRTPAEAVPERLTAELAPPVAEELPRGPWG